MLCKLKFVTQLLQSVSFRIEIELLKHKSEMMQRANSRVGNLRLNFSRSAKFV